MVVFKQCACFHGFGWWFDIGKIAGWDIFHSFPSYLSLDIFLIPRVIWENPGKAAIKTLSQRSIFYPKIPQKIIRKKSSGFFISGDVKTKGTHKKNLFWILWQKRTFGTVCNEIWSSAEKIHNIMSRDSLQFPDFLVSKTRKISSSKFSNLFSLSCLDDGIGRNLVTQTSLFLVCYWARWRAARHELWGFSDALATLHSLKIWSLPYILIFMKKCPKLV